MRTVEFEPVLSYHNQAADSLPLQDGNAITVPLVDLPDTYNQPAMFVDDVIDGQYRVTADFAIKKNTFARIMSAEDISSKTSQKVVVKAYIEPNDAVRSRVSKEIAAHLMFDGDPELMSLYGTGTFENISGNKYRYVALKREENDLDEFLRDKPQSRSRLLGIGITIARGLEKMHDSGMIHRDVKPGNVLISRESAKLTDFGIVETTEVLKRASVKRLRQVGSVAIWHTEADGGNSAFGTVGYMAPEAMLDGETPVYASDIFSLSVLMQEALTGGRPWLPKELIPYAKSVKYRMPVSARETDKSIPAALNTLFREGYDLHPENRPTPQEFIAGLQAARQLV